jgi:hypothetical protein
MAAVSRVTGSTSYDYFVYARRATEMEDVLRDAALQNLRRDPLNYAANVARSLVRAHVGVTTAFIDVFQVIQAPGVETDRLWFLPGRSIPPHPRGVSLGYLALMRVLTLLSAAGLVRAVRRREDWALGALTAWISVVAAHSITWLEMTHMYIRLPFVVLFAAAGLDLLRGTRAWGVEVDHALALLLAVAAPGLTLLLLGG